MPKLADRVKETSTTTGTGAIALAGAASGYQAFSSAFAVGDQVYYAIVAITGNAWEIGIGTLSAAATLARTTVLSSSNAGALVNFGAGPKDVFCTAPSTAMSGRYLGSQYFTSSGTYDKTVNNPSFVEVELVGGGGGSGGGGYYNASGAGAGGGYARKRIPASSLGDGQAITVGAAGNAGTTTNTVGAAGGDGTAGGTSSIGSIVSATGGGGGAGGPGGNEGVGGAAGTPGYGVGGDLNFSGSGVLSPLGWSMACIGGSVGYGGGWNGVNKRTAGHVGYAGIVIIHEYS